MSKLSVLITAALLASCTSRQASDTQPSAKRASDEAVKRNPGEVSLTPDAQKAAGLEIQRIEALTINETISATGQLVANEDTTASVGALADGRIARVEVNRGDSVKAGQVLARIHSHHVHETRAAYKTAQLELTRAESAVRQAQSVRDRARRLLDLKAGSPQELEGAEALLRDAQKALGTARAAVERERIHLVEFLGVAIEDADHSDRHLEDLVTIKAPTSGVIIDRRITPGSVVQAGQEAFRIANPATIWMIANVNESDLGQLKPGQPVRILVRAFPGRPFPGRIHRLGEQLDPITRTLQVRVLVPNSGNLLKPEMYALAEISKGVSRPSLFVPESAAQELMGARVLFVRTATDRFEARPIQVARTLDGNMEIVGGLRPNDEVVVRGSFVLKSELLKSSLAGE